MPDRSGSDLLDMSQRAPPCFDISPSETVKWRLKNRSRPRNRRQIQCTRNSNPHCLPSTLLVTAFLFPLSFSVVTKCESCVKMLYAAGKGSHPRPYVPFSSLRPRGEAVSRHPSSSQGWARPENSAFPPAIIPGSSFSYVRNWSHVDER